jgi:uncharacterized protein YqgC (DUF456 family)
MMIVVNVLVIVLMAVGLAGAALPFVPGTPLILAGALLYAIATDFTPVGVGRLAVLTGLALAGAAGGALAGSIGARRAGGSRRGALGALLGLIVGLFTGPIGLVAGPVAGAILGELSAARPWGESVRAGLGTLLGLIVGTVAHVAIAGMMVGLFVWWIWRG